MTSGWLHWKDARLEGSWQGISHVTVAPGPAAHSRLLRVRLHLPADGLGQEHFEIRGGKQGQQVSWSFAAPVDPAAREVGLVFQVLEAGTRGYQVVLLGGGKNPLHPFFSSAEFSLELERDTGDCMSTPRAAEKARDKRPPVDPLTKDYTGFLHLLADRVRVINPHWADLSPASLERVLLELLAHHADLLSYYQDRVASEAFLDDATQRHSIRQHGLLLGYPLFDGSSAETVMAFETRNDGELPAGLSVSMAELAGEAPVVFYLPKRARVVADHNRLRLAAWPGAKSAEVPAGATEVLLWGHVDGLLRGQRLAFVQGSSAQLVEISDVRHLRLQGWVERPESNAGRMSPELTAVGFQPALEVAVRPFTEDFALHGNLATAWHGEARVAHYHPPAGRDLPLSHLLIRGDRQHVVLQRPRDGKPLLRALRIPEGPVAFTRDAEGQPSLALEVRVNGEPWSRVEHFHGSLPFHQHFVATTDEDGSVWLQFGDGEKGAEVEDEGASVEIHYRVGAPISGNCAPGTLTRVIPPEEGAERAQVDRLGLSRLTNVTPGRGGRQPESRDAARLAIPASLRYGALQRAVSLEDYAAVAREVRGVARATARQVGGLFNTVLVLVDPEDQVELSAELRAAVLARLERYRMAGREVIVAGPIYVPIDLGLEVTVEPGAFAHRVRDAVYAALRPGTHTHPGFFHPDRLSFGDDIELGDILALVQKLPGVRSVKATTLRRLFDPSPQRLHARIALSSTEVARLDGDESGSEYGRLVVRIIESAPVAREVPR